MALKSTIHKAQLNLTDMRRNYYATHDITLARHPSETEERMMVRLLAFVRHAHERLTFGKGLSTEDEPDLWLKEYNDTISLWIEVGLPDEKRIRRACGRSEAVEIYLYGGSIADKWWRDNAKAMNALDKVSVFQLPDTAGLQSLCQRNMVLQCTLDGDDIWFSDDNTHVNIECITLKSSATP